MDRKGAWIIAGAVALGFVVLGMSQLAAQRGEALPEAWRTGLFPGRYVVVRDSGQYFILLDTATGDLYKAGPEDVKPYSARFGKESGAKDRPAIKDKDFPKDGVKDKDFPKDGFKDASKDRFKDKDFLKDKNFKDKDGFKDKGF